MGDGERAAAAAWLRNVERVRDFIYLTPEFAIGPQVTPEDFPALHAAGFSSVLNARPDDEIGEYVLSAEAEKLARAQGLDYGFAPTEGFEIFETEIVDRFERALIDLPKPIFSHCKTGTRSVMLWALVAARHRNVDDVIASLRDAGQEFDFFEDELRDAYDEARKTPLRLEEEGLLALGRSSLLGRNRA